MLTDFETSIFYMVVQWGF